MAEIDSLEIKIQSDAKNAYDELEKLSTQLNKIIKPLSAIMNNKSIYNLGKQFKSLSSELKTITNSANSLKTVTNSISGINKSMDNTQKKAKQVSKSAEEIAEKYKDLGKGFTLKGNTKQIQKQIDSLTNQLSKAKLAKEDFETSEKTNLGGYDTAIKNVIKYTNQIESLKNQLEELKNSDFTPKFSSEFEEKLKSDFGNLKANFEIELGETPEQYRKRIQEEFPELKQNIKLETSDAQNKISDITTYMEDFANKANNAGNLSETLGNKLKNIVVPEIREENITKLQSALKRTEKNLDILRAKLANGLTMGRFTESIDNSQFVNLQEKIAYAEKYAEALRNKISQVGTGENKTSKETNNLSNAFNKLKANASGASSSIGNIGNNLNKTLSGMKSFTRSILSATGIMGGLYGIFRGIASAMDISSDLTEVKNIVVNTFGQYASKLEELASNSIQTIGMSELSTKEVASKFQAMGVAMGFSAGKMSDMSIELTKLTGDMASFYNVSQEDVGKSLEAIFTGQTKPLRQYGIDLTQATLQEWAMKQGLDADISSMTQAEKTMLRYQYVLENTTNVQGDFARTMGTWHNQIVILKEQFKQLASIIGTAFINILKPVVNALNKVMSAVIAFTKNVVNALGSIFGWTIEIQGGHIDEAADASDDMAAGTGEAADNAKKMNKELQKGIRAFDELKVINLPDESTGGTDGGGGTGAGADGDISNNALKVNLKESEGLFKSNIQNLEQLGEYIGESLTNAMNNIDWQSIYDKAKNFGTGLAQFLNGLISPELFGEVGKTIASSLNTALYFLNSFGTTFDWEDFGESIAQGINDFFTTFDFKAAADTINIWIKGALTTATTMLKKTDFEQIGNKIGTFLKELDFSGILSDLATTIWEAIKSAFDLLKGMFEEAPLETSLIAAFGVLKFTGLGSLIAGKIKDAIVTNFLGGTAGTSIVSALGTNISTALTSLGGIGGLLTADIGTVLGAGTAAEIGLTLGSTILGGVAAAIIGWNIGQKLYEKFQEPIDSAVFAVGDFVTKTLPNAFKNAWEGIKKVWSPIYNWFNKNFLTPVKIGFNTALTFIKSIWSSVSNWFKDKVITPITTNFNYFKDGISKIFSGLWTVIKAVWVYASGWFNEKVITPIKTLFNAAKTAIENAFKNAWNIIKTVWNVVSGWFKTTVTEPIGKIFKSVTNAIEKGFKTALSGLKSAWESVSGWFNKTVVEPIKSIFKNFVNSIISGFNWILKKVGAEELDIWSGEVPAHAKGTNGLPNDEIGMVNDQRGSTYKELIVPPNGKPFIPEGRNVILPMKKGTKIMPADQTKALMQSLGKIPKFKNGIGDFFSNVFGNIKSFTGDIFDYIGKPKEILQVAFSKFVNPSGWTDLFNNIAGGALKTITSSATDFIKKIFDDYGDVKYDPSKGVAQWKPLAARALKMTEQYSSANLNALLNQMQHESGGNPRAINNWDINAKLGHPSKGLMQVIQPTFDSYAVKGFNKDIYDPLSNMLASIRYTVSRYGSLYKGWTARGYKGYAAGGFPEPYSIFAAGERGRAEILGTVGGKTAVAGGEEITGIREAVYSTSQQEIELLREQNRLLQGILNKEFGISQNDIGKAARNYSKEYFNRTGNPAYDF